MSAKTDKKTDKNNKKKDNDTMPRIVPTTAPAAPEGAAPVTAANARAPRVTVDMERIRLVDVPCEAKNVYIDDIHVGTVYRADGLNVSRCNDRVCTPTMPGILEFDPTEKDKNGDAVVTLDKLTAWMSAAGRKAWGKTEKPLSSAQLEFIEFRVSKGDSPEVAEKKARSL